MLGAFTAGLLLITISELGDKTFFIAVILAMRHSRRLVFIGVMAALAAMTVLSVLVGQAASIIPQIYIKYAEIALFFGFGLKLLYEASQMSANSNCAEEAIEAVKQTDLKLPRYKTNLAILLKVFTMTFLAEWGDRTQIATIALAASKPALAVTAGAILGHSICTAIAVLGGRLIEGRLSEQKITAIGGCLFLIFVAIGLREL